MVASPSVKPRQQNRKHSGRHQLKTGDENADIGRPSMSKPWLANIESGLSMYVQMPNRMKTMTISNDCNCNVEQVQEWKQQLMPKQPVVEMGKSKDDKNKNDKNKNDKNKDDNNKDDDKQDDEDQEDEYFTSICQEIVDS